MADRHTKEFDQNLERMITGPRILALAPDTNNGRVHVQVDGEEQILFPGQTARAFGHGIVVVCERGGDGCHITVG